MLTQSSLKKALYYSPRTGDFYSAVTGKQVGHISGRQLRIIVYRKEHAARDLAWLYMKGVYPSKEDPVAFLNGDSSDLSFSNLCLQSRLPIIASKVCCSPTIPSCGRSLPISEYYVSSNGNLNLACKYCYRKEYKKRKRKSQITLDQVRSEFTYDPETGVLLRSGNIAGSLTRFGYSLVVFNYKKFFAHRLIWWLHTGYRPTRSEEIDHINHIRNDNRWVNLRIVSRRENSQNLSLLKRNVSGVAGVSYVKSRNKWVVSITVDGKRLNLGRFANFEDAVSERMRAELLYGYHENHGKNPDDLR